MSDKQHRRGRQPDDQNSDDRKQTDVGQTPSSTLESKILAQLGLGGDSAEAWQKNIHIIKQITEEEDPDLSKRKRIVAFLDAKNHPQKAVRMAAIRGLLTLEGHHPGLVPPEPFIKALNDPEPQVRALAMEALIIYDVRRLPSDVLNTIEKALQPGNQREDELVRMAIVPLLASLGEDAPLQVLVDALHDEHWQVREAAVLALGPFIKRLGNEQREQLEQTLYDDDDFVREAALLVLRERLPIARLRKDLQTAESKRRMQAARILAETGDTSQETLKLFYDIVRNEQAENQLRVAALFALAKLYKGLDDETLKHLLKHNNEDIREAARFLAHTLDPQQYPLFEDEADSAETAAENVTDIERYRSTRKRKGPIKDDGEKGS